MKRSTVKVLSLIVALGLVATACGSTNRTSADTLEGTTITLVTHDSFALSDSTLKAFTERTGVKVDILESGDAGTMVSQAILSAGNPVGDVMYGIDNTFLQRGLDAGLFEPYTSPALSDVPDKFKLDPQHRVTPIDFGDVCVNYWTDALGTAPPTDLADLTKPEYAGKLVVENPETSSPGFAFLLATIVRFKDWEGYWAGLRANDVKVASGWEDAYYSDFTAGGGDRPLVVSYASSPVAEVVYADPPVETAPTGVLADSCFRQIEFAGVLKGTPHRAAAQALIDFMLTPTFQDDVPLNMFVFPVTKSAILPKVFLDNVTVTDTPLTLDPATIEANRDKWTARWSEIVLG